jgi:exonuclease III
MLRISLTRITIKKNKYILMTILKILTYNVCWECISGSNKGSAKIQGEKCGKTKQINNKNLCYRNVSKIASYSNFDIICLQEGNIGLAKNIIKKLGSNYKLVYSKSCNEHSILIYNSLKLKKKGKRFSGQLEECGRAFLYQTFIDIKSNKEIVVGNFHGPHLKYDWVTKYILKSNKLSSNKSRIIILGDFNKELRKPYKIKKTKKIIRPINYNLKTCSNKDALKNISEETYNETIDNILLSDNVKVINKPETLNNINNILLPKDTNYNLANYSSDHRPIAVKIQI